jgi:serine protease Do
LRAKSGAVVVAVAADAPYSAQGRLQEADVIHAINGEPITSVAELKRHAVSLKPGAAVALQIERDGQLQFIAFRVPR